MAKMTKQEKIIGRMKALVDTTGELIFRFNSGMLTADDAVSILKAMKGKCDYLIKVLETQEEAEEK
jgi:hypothetical protein